jgi:hypothetical protein
MALLACERFASRPPGKNPISSLSEGFTPILSQKMLQRAG